MGHARSARARRAQAFAAAILAILLPCPTAAQDACAPTGAHAAHATQGFACGACHACGGLLGFAPYTFPGGATTVGGTVTPAGPATTCSVGCHSPFGAEPRPVAWNAGPLACTDCHSNVPPPGAAPARSSHFGAGDAAACRSCHDHSQHTRGQVLIVGDDGTGEASTCAGCHAGLGQTLAGETPPVLVGWNDAAGDFHGERTGTCRFDLLDAAGTRSVGTGALPCPAGQPPFPSALRITSRWWYVSGTQGPWAYTCDIETVDEAGNRIAPTLLRQPCPQGTFLNSACNNPAGDPDCRPVSLVTRGFGGELRAPYARGQGALPCSACHDAHASANAFLLASTVNGVAMPPESIDRAGVGAQALCEACHQGERHEVCQSCHKELWVTDGEYSWFEGEPVDPSPAGSACFYCHGHEGIRHMRVSSPAWPGSGHPFGMAGRDRGEDACSHCHSGWRPPPTEYVAPGFQPGASPAVSGITATSAIVRWTTTEPATTWVEYGIGDAGFVVGGDAFVREHAVTLTGLAPGATYVWRVRTSDAFRNVTRTALASFTTPDASAVPAPDLAAVSVGATVGTHSATVALVWYPVTAPSGTAVEYEVQLASDPAFAQLVNGYIPGGVQGIPYGDSGWIDGTPTVRDGRPALSHPATVTNIPQDDCNEIVPNVYYWRVRARDEAGHVSEWSPAGTFGAFAGDPWC
jgi:predicted CXXCH cytochrome family protein